MNVGQLGQVFTPPEVVSAMLGLRRNRGSVLEPSAGGGAFMSRLGEGAVGIEVDPSVIRDGRTVACDFFAYPEANRYDTVIGNPPYVRFRDIPAPTRRLLPTEWFDRRSNLCLFFIAKCMAHLDEGGELILITPRDFLKQTSAARLNAELYRQGSFTDFTELGDSKVFGGHTPNCAVWRWEKGRTDRRTTSGETFCFRDGQIWFARKEGSGNGTMADLFDVRVGAVSGADSVFASEKHGNVDMVCSTTRAGGGTRRMVYNMRCGYLEPFKERLLARRIRRFDESNWWQWGRGYHRRSGGRIYVNAKTRNPRPFFASEVEAYDGSVLALFPRADIDLPRAAEALNGTDWESLGFACGGRLLFSQRSLQNAPAGDLS